MRVCKLKILTLSMCDLSKSSPAREHFVGLGNGFQLSGCRVIGVCPHFGVNKIKDSGDVNFELSRIKIFLTYKYRLTRLIGFAYLYIHLFFSFPLLLMKYKPDIIYCRHMPADIYFIMLSLLTRRKFIVEINGDVSADRNITKKSRLLTKVLAACQLLSLRYSHFVIVPTHGLKKNLASIYGISESKICHAENAISLDTSSLNSNSYENSEIVQDKFIVGYAGTFSTWQGIPLIVHALEYLNQTILQQMQFVLVGDGPEYASIKKLVDKYNYGAYFLFTGSLEQTEYMRAISCFDICLAPYIKERNDFWGVSPIKIHSYMACAKPIITSNISGANDLINDAGCGYLFQPDSARSLADTIEKAFCERKNLSAMGRRGLDYVSSNNTWSHTASKILEFQNG